VQTQNGTLLLATVPMGLVGGTVYDLRIENPDGGTTRLIAAFEAVEPPVVDSVAPDRGTVGTEVRIYGSAFAADSVAVFFDELPSPHVERDGNVLFAVAPKGLTAGTRYDIRVVNGSRGAATLASAYEAVPPQILRVNSVTRPTGLIGMTVILEGDAFGDLLREGEGKVFFEASDGTPIQAAIADTVGDWTNTFIVTAVPQNTASTSRIWVETATGVSNSVEFQLMTSGVFSPSTINWTRTTALPQPLRGLGAVFIPIEDGAAPSNLIFTIGGADSLQAPTTAVYRSNVQGTGALDAWATDLTPLPEARAYHTTVAATAYTAALDTTTTAAVLYVLGGKAADGSTTTTVYSSRVSLDGQIAEWKTTTPLPAPIHSAGAVLFRGYIYLAGGATAENVAVANAYRAKVNGDGSLGPWEAIAPLPSARAYFSLVNFGPYIYAVGGETGTSSPEHTTLTGAETAGATLARINIRNGALQSTGWSALASMAKSRSKHSTVFAGGALFVTSGLYSGQAGSSENTYAPVNSDGTLASWNGATGAETIGAEIGYSIFNQAMITFVDSTGKGHVLVLGGTNRSNGKASAEVVFY
jgi:hypothetical protein